MKKISIKFHTRKLAIIIFVMGFAGISLGNWKSLPQKVRQLSIHVHPCYPLQLMKGNSFNRPNYSLKKLNHYYFNSIDARNVFISFL